MRNNASTSEFKHSHVEDDVIVYRAMNHSKNSKLGDQYVWTSTMSKGFDWILISNEGRIE